jgi:hypothetical protein
VLGLYGVAGATWLPVVWLQIRMRDLALGRRRRYSSAVPLLALRLDLGGARRPGLRECARDLLSEVAKAA